MIKNPSGRSLKSQSVKACVADPQSAAGEQQPKEALTPVTACTGLRLTVNGTGDRPHVIEIDAALHRRIQMYAEVNGLTVPDFIGFAVRFCVMADWEMPSIHVPDKISVDDKRRLNAAARAAARQKQRGPAWAVASALLEKGGR